MGIPKKRRTIWWGLILALPSMSLLSADQVDRVDIADCEKTSCYSKWIKSFEVEKDVSVRAWFDIVDPFKEGNQSVYPLFNVYNNTGAEIKVRIGMQLLDEENKIVVEASQETSFTPFNKTESEYKTYRSIKPSRLTAEQIRKTKYVAVIYRRI
jgi:hypothetical protein